ncbi:MAG: tRNA pseudouridine(38-40) synthase TruA [Muribaculaceae bacterium]|nr:tRNA pseudouridine(38-40) synthase TruA [Muribaculaceae bacterium]
MRYFLKLSFQGAAYHGWQIQPNDVSVQETIEKVLAMVLRRDTPITGAGRTDAGVNAMTMYAHFDVEKPIDDVDKLKRSLNGILPGDIAIHEVIPVHDTAHARFDAVSRTYRYFAHTAKSPVLAATSWQCSPRLDFDLMNQAAQHLLQYEDFTSFSKLHTDVKTNICHVTEAHWDRCHGIDTTVEQWVFTITADRFLRNMVRAIVGTLVEVGNHKISVEEFCRIIEKKDRCAAGTSMPAYALFLWDVKYPYI